MTATEARPECSVEGCDRTVAKIGLCTGHARRKYQTGDPGGPFRAYRKADDSGGMQEFPCAACGKPVWRQRSNVKPGNRVFHAECRTAANTGKRRSGGMKPCALEGCDREFYVAPAETRRYCSNEHVNEANRNSGARVCVGCGITFVKPLGDTDRWHDRDCYLAQRRRDSIGRKKVNSDGYVLVHLPDHPNAQRSTGWVLEHVALMSDLLGRPLIDGEEVHHLNKVKDDNSVNGPLVEVNGSLRSGNLELWNCSQPSGARVPELVDYARSIMRLYVPEELRETA